MLITLPIRGISDGPIVFPLTALTIFRTAIAIVMALFCLPLYLTLFIQVLIAALAVWGLHFEAADVLVNTMQLSSSKLAQSTKPIRLLHLSDLHFEFEGRRERQLLEMMKSLDPDLILFTGDFINLSHSDNRETWNALNTYLAKWPADIPTYCVSGTPMVESREAVEAFIDGTPIHWLDDDVIRINIRGQELSITGITCRHDLENDERRVTEMARNLYHDLFNIMLFHSPDAADVVAGTAFDLYLAGHTHGGQIRLPLIGAVVTSSMKGHRYVMGEYMLEDTTLYVSRGVGMEGASAPRARLLCRPEIILWELRNK